MYSESDSGDCLGNDCGCSSTFDAPVEAENEEQVKSYIQDCRAGKPEEGRDRISDSPEQSGEVVVEKGESYSPVDNPQVVPHRVDDICRDLQPFQNWIKSRKSSSNKQNRDPSNEDE